MLAVMSKKIQIILLIGIAIAGIRLAWILHERHQNSEQSTKQEPKLFSPDFYVTPKKLYPYDLKTARQLTQQPAWVKVGYAYPYYSYDPTSRKASLAKESGKLLPLQKLDIKDVVLGTTLEPSGKKQVLAVFQQGEKWYVTPVGTEQSGDYSFFCNDMLFFEDPHGLYNDWSPSIWQQIDQHQAKLGMSELEVGFSLGIGLLESGSDETDRTLNYPNGGNPLRVSFHDDKAIQIEPGSKE